MRRRRRSIFTDNPNGSGGGASCSGCCCQAPPASPDTGRCPAGPSTEPGSGRSGRAPTAGACKHTQPSLSSLPAPSCCGCGAHFRKLGKSSDTAPQPGQRQRPLTNKVLLPSGSLVETGAAQRGSRGRWRPPGGPRPAFTRLAGPPWAAAAAWGRLSSGGGGVDESAMKRSPPVAKETGGHGSRPAPLCNWTRMEGFLDAEKKKVISRGPQPHPTPPGHPPGWWPEAVWKTCRRTEGLCCFLLQL